MPTSHTITILLLALMADQAAYLLPMKEVLDLGSESEFRARIGACPVKLDDDDAR